MKILVSACLLGIDCKYNGKNNKNDKIIELLKDHELIPVCPEIMGGLPTPRIPAEIHQNKVIAKDGKEIENMTEAYTEASGTMINSGEWNGMESSVLKKEAPHIIEKMGIGKKTVNYKLRDCGKVYDGTFTGTLINGDGITARLLKEHGIKITGETTLDITE